MHLKAESIIKGVPKQGSDGEYEYSLFIVNILHVTVFVKLTTTLSLMICTVNLIKKYSRKFHCCLHAF